MKTRKLLVPIFILSLISNSLNASNTPSDHTANEMTPNERLIIAAKGTKPSSLSKLAKASATLLTPLVNPLVAPLTGPFVATLGLPLIVLDPKTGVEMIVNPVGSLMGLSGEGACIEDIQAVQNALDLGAEIDFQETASAYTALIYAAYYGEPEIVAYLLMKGASANIKEDGGYNAYTMAKYYLNWNKKLLERLSKEDNEETKARLQNEYQDKINRYSQIVSLLETLTSDKTMPSSWF